MTHRYMTAEHHGAAVRVYRNLNLHTYSVQIDRRVAGYADHLIIYRPEFKVSQAGRARVLREGRKNVHAYIVGTLESANWWDVDLRMDSAPGLIERVTYDPRTAGCFFSVRTGEPVTQASRALLHPGGLWIIR